MRHATARAGLLILLIAAAHPAARGQRFKADPVEKVRRVLTDEYKATQVGYPAEPNKLPGSVAADERRKEYADKLDRAIRALGDGVNDTSRALLLLEWNRPRPSPSALPRDFDVAVSGVEVAARSRVLANFIKSVSESLSKSSGETKQIALCNLIGESLSGSGDPQGDEAIIRDLRRVADSLAGLAESDASAEVRVAASRALGRFYAEVPTVSRVWRRLLKPGEPEAVRRASAESLERMLVATTGVERLQGSEPGVSTRDRVTKTVLQRDELIRMVSGLVPVAGLGASDEVVAVRLPAVRALRQAAAALKGTVDDDSARLKDLAGRAVSPSLKEEVAYSLGVAKEVDKAVKAFTSLADVMRARLVDPDPNVRQEARMTLATLGRLRSVLADEEAALGRMREDLGAEFPRPKEESKPKDGKKDMTDVRALAAPPARQPLFLPSAAKFEETLAGLAKSLAAEGFSSPDAPSRRAAAEAIEALGETGRPLVPAMNRALKDKDPFVRWIVARTLGKLGRYSAGGVPGLIGMLDDDDQDARIAAYTALGRIGQDTAPAEEGTPPASKESEAARKAAAVALLDAVGPINERLLKGDAEVRLSAIHALEGIGPASEPALANLVKLFENEDARVRREAAELVGRFEEKAKPYLPQLKKLVEDRDSSVRGKASAAILAIDR